MAVQAVKLYYHVVIIYVNTIVGVLLISIVNYPWRRERQAGRLRAAPPLRIRRVPSGAHWIPKVSEHRRVVHTAEPTVVTRLIAREAERPSAPLPVVLMWQPEMPLPVCREDAPLHMPEDLTGPRIGVRALGAPGAGPGPRAFDANVVAFETITEYALGEGITTRRPGLRELFAH
jgi:hypothetical protein